jgi:hypothetical protein
VNVGCHPGARWGFRRSLGRWSSISKRICDLAGPAQVFVSETVKGLLVGSGILLSDQGVRILKGVPDEWRLFVVES